MWEKTVNTLVRPCTAAHSRSRLLLVDGVLDALHDGALPLSADLLRALEGDERELEVVGGLLQ